MTSPRSITEWRVTSDEWPAKSFHKPTASILFPEITTAPFSIGGCETGRIVRARRITLHSGVALGVFEFGGVLVFVRLDFVVTLADLLLDFFCHAVNGRIQIAFAILGKQIRAAHGEAQGATELFFRH